MLFICYRKISKLLNVCYILGHPGMDPQTIPVDFPKTTVRRTTDPLTAFSGLGQGPN